MSFSTLIKQLQDISSNRQENKMVEVLQKQKLSEEVYQLKLNYPELAKYARPGHYVMIKTDEKSKRTPFFITNNDNRSISICFSNKVPEGKKLEKLRKGSALALVAGLYGTPFPIKEYGNIAWVAEHEHIAMMCYLAEQLKNQNNKMFMIAIYKSKKQVFFENKVKKIAHRFSLVTSENDDTLYELQNLFRKRHIQVFAMNASPELMKKMAHLSKLRAKTYSCITPSCGDDGIGITGKARILCNGEMKLVSVDGPFFDAHTIDWNHVA